jgi:Leucine-rich repeat (LRR) protein
LKNENGASEMKRTIITLLAVAIIGGILSSGCVVPPPEASEPPPEAPVTPPEQPPPEAPSLPIKINLFISEPPVLGKTVQVTATFYLETGYEDVYFITVRIIVSEGFLKVSSEEWKGYLTRGNTYTLTTTIQAIKTGDWKIEALASSNISDDVLGYAELPVSVPTLETVTFPDEYLETAIRDALGKPVGEAITPAELAGLTELTANMGVHAVGGGFWIPGISDLSPLASLTNLTYLNLQGNAISDLSPLASLTNLTYLRLDYNRISDLSPLASLTNLNDLVLSRNQISDISPLASLTNLTYLHLQRNQISDISPLASLTNLNDLRLDYNQISDISPLASLTNLTYLQLNRNQISDISPLASLTNLTRLGLDWNHISDISSLTSLTNLTYLGLERNQISDISPLVENSGLGAGDKVSIWDNNLDLSEGSEDLENIRQLEGRGVKVHY